MNMQTYKHTHNPQNFPCDMIFTQSRIVILVCTIVNVSYIYNCQLPFFSSVLQETVKNPHKNCDVQWLGYVIPRNIRSQVVADSHACLVHCQNSAECDRETSTQHSFHTYRASTNALESGVYTVSQIDTTSHAISVDPCSSIS